MRPVTAGAAQVVAAERQAVGRVGIRLGEQLVGVGVIERRPLELEEQQLRLDLGGALLDALQQRPAGRIGGVGREPQRGVGAGASDEVVDPLELVHRPLEPGGVELSDLAGVLLGEAGRGGDRLIEHPGDAGIAVLLPSISGSRSHSVASSSGSASGSAVADI